MEPTLAPTLASHLQALVRDPPAAMLDAAHADLQTGRPKSDRLLERQVDGAAAPKWREAIFQFQGEAGPAHHRRSYHPRRAARRAGHAHRAVSR